MVSWHAEKGDFPLYCSNEVLGFVDMFVCFQPNQRGQKQVVCLQSSSLVFRSRLKCIVVDTETSSRGRIRLSVQMDVWIGYMQSVVMLLAHVSSKGYPGSLHRARLEGALCVILRSQFCPPEGASTRMTFFNKGRFTCKNKGNVEKRQWMQIAWFILRGWFSTFLLNTRYRPALILLEWL